MRQKATKQLAAILLSLIMILGLVPLIPASVNAQSEQGETVLAFTSDTHNEPAGEAADRLENWIKSVNSAVGGTGIDFMTFCGDLGKSQGEGPSGAQKAEYWEWVQKIINVADDENILGKEKVAFTTGNHECIEGQYTVSGNYSSSETASRFSVNKCVKEDADNYEVYCLGSTTQNQSYSLAQATELKNYLSSRDTSKHKIYFIASHYPLHYCSTNYGSRTTSNAIEIINTINNAVTEYNLNVVFLWGHNHSEVDYNYNETNGGKRVYRPVEGENQLKYSSSGTTEIKFNYCTAGCMSDSENSTGHGGEVGPKGVVFRVAEDASSCKVEYYGNNFTKLSNSVTELALLEPDDTVKVKSISLNKSTLDLEIDQSEKLTVSFDPEDATNKAIEWSSDKETVAKVDKDGNVTGVATGKCTITATAKGGKNVQPAKCIVNVTAKSVTPDPSGGGNSGDQSKNNDKTTDNVNTARQTALNQLNSAISQANLANYGTDQQLTIINLAMDYKKKINAATSSDQVNKLIAEFNAAVNKLPKASNTNGNAANTAKATKITLKGLTAGKNKLTVKWTAKANVFDGYEVSYRVKGKKWKALKVSGAKKSSKVIKKLKKGKTYQVKVRGYKMSGNTAVYGKYSKTKTKKVK